MSEEKLGMKETLEVIDFAEVAVCKILVASKDGMGMEDLALLMDKELWEKGKAAVDQMNAVVPEMKDMDLTEAGQLVMRSIALVKAILEAAKKPA